MYKTIDMCVCMYIYIYIEHIHTASPVRQAAAGSVKSAGGAAICSLCKETDIPHAIIFHHRSLTCLASEKPSRDSEL